VDAGHYPLYHAVLLLVLLQAIAMASVKLSTKGQIVIPKEIREAKDWSPGTEFEVILTDAGVLLSPLPPLPATTVQDGLGLLAKKGRRRLSQEETERRIGELVLREDRGSRK